MSGSSGTSTTTGTRPGPAGGSGLDRFFHITERGSSVPREIRGGVVTFFTMAYIVVLNPLIIGTVQDADGQFLGGGDAPNLALVAAATALVAGGDCLVRGARRPPERWLRRPARGSGCHRRRGTAVRVWHRTDDQRVEHDDVGHREERHQPTADLPRDGRAPLGDREEPVQASRGAAGGVRR